MVDDVTETHERYFVVRKLGVGAAIAKKLDPRTR